MNEDQKLLREIFGELRAFMALFGAQAEAVKSLMEAKNEMQQAIVILEERFKVLSEELARERTNRRQVNMALFSSLLALIVSLAVAFIKAH